MSHLLYGVALAALTQATPFSVPTTIIDVTLPPPAGLLVSRAPQIFIPAPTDTLKCTSSTFANKTTQYSAALADCRCIVESLSTTEWAGKFFVRPSDGSKFGTTAVTCRSCAFVLESQSEFGTNMGAKDVAGYIGEAVERFVREGGDKIGAEGETVCENDSGGEGVDEFSKTKWVIAHVPN
ncbi:uncharacterized protein DNG_04780 [Cephalotrichum gorgonifer]|uniref:Ecp2 effector protein-like domain-containing protein n=1 Tax=Cephalotrichum gorgonifer TaxID=2041049 RepID=A0AAE8MX26_9PEZI|nr:uncharacterized protein DNG_04780 [Cephalotrichum gorgonifer]